MSKSYKVKVVENELYTTVSANAYVSLDEHDALMDVSNAFPFQRILETDKAAYLVRQYFCSSLYDRIR